MYVIAHTSPSSFDLPKDNVLYPFNRLCIDGVQDSLIVHCKMEVSVLPFLVHFTRVLIILFDCAVK